MLPGPIDPKKSIEEVWRVVNEEVAVMAIEDGRLIGTMGLIRPAFWWGDIHFLVNRWLFAIPGSKAWRPLLKEALAIASAPSLSCTSFRKSAARCSSSTSRNCEAPMCFGNEEKVKTEPSKPAWLQSAARVTSIMRRTCRTRASRPTAGSMVAGFSPEQLGSFGLGTDIAGGVSPYVGQPAT
jgi:hypothetical protein